MAQRDSFLDAVLKYEGDQFRVTDFRDRSVTDTTEVTLEPENPNSDQTPLRMGLFDVEQKISQGDMTQGVPDPRRVHEQRSEYAQNQDEARDAQITTDPVKYANDPDSLDFPGVDTGPTFREENPDFNRDSFFDQFFDF